MADKRKTSVVKKEQTPQSKPSDDGGFDLAAYDPELAALFDSSASQDFENLQPDDLALPRINLQNFTSSLVKKPKDEGGCEAGCWASNIDNHLYTKGPKEELIVIPLRHYKSRINFWPMTGVGPSGLKCQSHDFFHGQGNPGGDCRRCTLKDWGNENEPPECQEVHNFVCLVPGEDDQHSMGVISFRSKSFPAGRQWVQLTTTMTKGRLFTRVFRLGVEIETVGKNDFYIPTLRKWDEMNRFDLNILNAFPDKSKEEVISLLVQARDSAQMVENLRNQGAFKVADAYEDQQPDVDDPQYEAVDETGSGEEMPWEDIAQGSV